MREHTFLICGLGSIGTRHLKNISSLGYKDIVLVREKNQILSKFNLKYPIYNSITEALKEKPDVSLICNPSSMHVPYAIACANQSSHVLVEKPLSNSLVRVQELKEICKRRGLVCMVGYMMRYHPLIKMIKSFIESGKIGELIYLKSHWGEYLPDWHPWEDYRESYASNSDMGGGPALTLSHDIDLILWLVGNEIKEVKRLDNCASNLQLSTEHGADFLFSFENNVTASAHLDFFQKPPERYLKIIGTEGTLSFNYYKNELWYSGHDGDHEVFNEVNFDRNQLFMSELNDFIETIDSKKSSPIPIEDSEKLLRIL